MTNKVRINFRIMSHMPNLLHILKAIFWFSISNFGVLQELT